MRRFLPLLLLVLAFPACGADYSARVVGITDGDTITVLTAAKKPFRIRLWGIDAPETGQDFGSRAKQAASELAFGKTGTIRARDIDRYGRMVAEVILPDGRSMNREIVRQGMAWWYRQPTQPRLPQAGLPRSGGHEREEPRHVRRRGGRREGGVSAGGGLLVALGCK